MANTKYYFKVRGYKNTGTVSSFTNVAAATTTSASPTPTPTPTSANRTVKFAWHASSSPEVVGYKIFWGMGSNNYQSVRDVKNVLTTSLTLSTSTKYYVAVAAYSMTETSDLSNEVVAPASW
jgi:hypothetical protein